MTDQSLNDFWHKCEVGYRSVIAYICWIRAGVVQMWSDDGTTLARRKNALAQWCVAHLGKNLQQLRHPRLLRKWLKSVELVLLCMTQTNLLMETCSWLSRPNWTPVQTSSFAWGHFRTDINGKKHDKNEVVWVIHNNTNSTDFSHYLSNTHNNRKKRLTFHSVGLSIERDIDNTCERVRRWLRHWV